MFRPISRLEFTKLSFVKAIKSIWPEFLFAGQQVKVEWNGSWWDALVREIDGKSTLFTMLGLIRVGTNGFIRIESKPHLHESISMSNSS